MSALRDALLARADDRLVLGHRLSEWCGHAPALEEDLALANIALDLLGSAQDLYAWAGRHLDPPRDADALVFFRGPTEYRNVLLVEQPNRDFAHTLVRQFFFDASEAAWLPALRVARDGDETLAHWAATAERDGRYHLRHSSAWVRRLGDGTPESHRRCQDAVDTLWGFCDELFAVDAACPAETAARVEHAWRVSVGETLEAATLVVPEAPAVPASGGRDGIHSEHLERLLSEMQSVARADPEATW